MVKGRALLAVLLLALVPAAAGAATAVPKLTLVSSTTTKLTIGGSGFKSGETVTVTAKGNTTTSANVKASSTGAFQVTLAKPKPTVCGGITVRAAGSLGSSASLQIGPAECNPPI